MNPAVRLSRRWFPWVFALLMGGAMTLIVTLALSLAQGFTLSGWMGRWLLAWLVATPAIVLLAPGARRLAARIAESPLA
jgi:hypothetical protein